MNEPSQLSRNERSLHDVVEALDEIVACIEPFGPIEGAAALLAKVQKARAAIHRSSTRSERTARIDGTTPTTLQGSADSSGKPGTEARHGSEKPTLLGNAEAHEKAVATMRGATPSAAVTRVVDTPRCDALESNALDSFDYRAWGSLAQQLERELSVANENRRLQANAIRKYEAALQSAIAAPVDADFRKKVEEWAKPGRGQMPFITWAEWKQLVQMALCAQSATALCWHPVSEQPKPDELYVVRDKDGQLAFAEFSYRYGWEHTADVDCGDVHEWFPLPSLYQSVSSDSRSANGT